MGVSATGWKSFRHSAEECLGTGIMVVVFRHVGTVAWASDRGTIENILSSCITAWFGNCTVSDRKTLRRIGEKRTAEKITGVSLPSITDMYITRCIRKANSIVDDPTHPSDTLLTLLPSGKRLWTGTASSDWGLGIGWEFNPDEKPTTEPPMPY
ncbi:hypothetical protein QTP86_010692 [Hemibagrus guttatus]|nr:hypothetical protein QTP86_010692 [Hemibagrus guttatus]